MWTCGQKIKAQISEVQRTVFEFDLRIKYTVRESEVAVIYVKGNELRQIARIMLQIYEKLWRNKRLLNG